jgi:RNA polymerase sigma factor (sigma-70 family)
MPRGSAQSTLLRQIEALYALGTLAGLADSRLIEIFLSRTTPEAEDAFAALVHRHGPTVLSVCRRMLASSHDCEDAFQATFLVLARRAASIGRREQLANWLYGVAVRTAREVRRRNARFRDAECAATERLPLESQPAETRVDLLDCLDEELGRLPSRYRSAILACEIEGKSRHEAALQLGVPEGTLSTHLARARKLLRERLQRRGVSLEAGPFTGLAQTLTEHAVPERLIVSTVQAAAELAANAGASATVATLASRVIQTMFAVRLKWIVASLLFATVASLAAGFGLNMLAAGQPEAKTPAPRADELLGRVVDGTGKGVPDAQVWVIGGNWVSTETLATVTTDARGQFIVPGVSRFVPKEGRPRIFVVARGRDGRIGWIDGLGRGRNDGKPSEVALAAIGDVRGLITDQSNHPAAGVEVAVVLLARGAERRNTDYIRLTPELTAFFKTRTANNGSFVLSGIPHGATIHAKLEAPEFGNPTVSWDTSAPTTFALDSRLGRIAGRFKAPDARGLPAELPLWLSQAAQRNGAAPRPYFLLYDRSFQAGADGKFECDGIPPGEYVVHAYFDRDGVIAAKPEHPVEVGPGATVSLEIPLQRVPTISGRLIDARTGEGIAGISLRSVLVEQPGTNSNRMVATATTDAEGCYTIAGRPGKIMIRLAAAPKSHKDLDYADYPRLIVNADTRWPDLKLAPTTGIDGIVVDSKGQPVAGAEVHLVAPDAANTGSVDNPKRTGPDGTFHLERLDPADTASLRARTALATSDGAVVFQPDQLKDKLTLTIDPKNNFQLRGLVTDQAGKRIPGATVTLWWNRAYVSKRERWSRMSVGNAFETYTTTDNGWFVFRNLWAGDSYSVVVEAKGHAKAEPIQVTGKAGETHDFGKVVLININGRLAGRVIGTDGQPIAGASVFNRGDAPERVAVATDQEGNFTLEGFFPGVKYAFVRKSGYRFTGVRVASDDEDLTITLRKTSEPPPSWKSTAGSRYENERAFARQILTRIWGKYGQNPEENGTWLCVRDMAAIDLELAFEWSGQHGHRYDGMIRQVQAKALAKTDPARALALLNPKLDADSQTTLQELADQFAETDPKKALAFAEKAAEHVGLVDQPNRTSAMAAAGAMLIKLGRTDAGRKLLDPAVHDAGLLPTENRPAYIRGEVARLLAPFDVQKALSLIEPIKDDGTENHGYRAWIAATLATTDTRKAIELVETVGGPAFDHEQARTEIAYKIAPDRPDEAIKIIEEMHRDFRTIWQAEAFGWLAEAIALRDKARAYSLIDRALTMMIDEQDRMARSASTGGEMAGAAHVALCARRVGDPDMESVIMRILAARPGDPVNRGMGRRSSVQSLAVAAIPLALLDPEAARTVLEQIELRSGLEPSTLWNAREPWMIAWGLVDLQKAATLVDSGLTELAKSEKPDLWNSGLFQTAELLATRPDLRPAALSKSSPGGFWSPDNPR